MRNTFFFLLLFFTFSACSSHSVSHLNCQPWAGEVPRSLAMKYWTFEYTTRSGPDEHLLVTGTAWPQKAAIPVWGRWLRALNLAVYLCDEQGNVLASQHQSMPEQKMPSNTGIAFTFHLKPKSRLRAPLFVAFGYRMEVVKNRRSRVGRFDSELRGEHDEIFFASQGSVLN